MTLESANICSKLLTLGAGETTQLSRAGKPQAFAPRVRREVAGLVAEANGLPSTAAPKATNIAMCSFQYRNTFSWELAFGLGSSELDPKFGRKGNGLYENREVYPPALFVRGDGGQVLQRRVSSNGKDAGDRLRVSTRRMQRQGTLAFTSLSVEIRFRLHQGGTMKKLRLSVVMVAVFASGFWPDARKPPRSHLMFPTVFANRSIKQASKTSPSVRIATRAS